MTNSRTMKKPLAQWKYALSTIFPIVFLGAAFSVPSANAATIYQQLVDSSSEVSLSDFCSFPNYTDLGTFQVNSQTTLSSSAYYFGVFNSPSGANTTLNIVIASSTTAGALINFALAHNFDPDVDYFLEIPYDSGIHTLVGGYSYHLLACDNTTDVETRSNLSSSFAFGYLTDDGITSVPVSAGIPGFTDVGISTTSQQVWCNQNFATTSGFLDSLGQSIALGACNVGVFLFVPSTGALANFASLASTTQTKIPFSYVYEVRDIFSGLSASTTSNLSTLTINFPSIGSSTPLGSLVPSTVVVLSTSTIGTYLSEPIRAFFLSLQRIALWAAFLFLIYRRIIPHHVMEKTA